ncbi:MAG TPA: hypothetical protein VGE07_25110 [Herpetosiphonaceae bacterium]
MHQIGGIPFMSLPYAAFSSINIERASVIELVQERLATIKPPTSPYDSSAQPGEMPIINLYGITGIGKTMVIRQLFSHFYATTSLIWCDFQGDAHDQPQATTWHAIIDHLRDAAPGLEHLSDSVLNTPNGPIDPRETKLSCQTSFHPGAPLIVLLDHLDGLPYWKSFQEHFLRPLVEQQNIVVVCTSQSPLFWHFWELRDQCQLYGLEPFAAEETEAFLQRIGWELLSRNIQSLTQGYPMAIVNLLATWGDKDDDDAEAEGGSPARAQLLAGLSQAAAEVLATTAILRRIDIAALRILLASFLPHWSDSTHAQKQLVEEILPELHGSGHVLNHPQGYRYKPAMRKRYERELAADDPQGYRALNEAAAALYADWVQREPVTRKHAFNEWLYHSCALAESAAAPDRAAWSAQLDQLFRRAQLIGLGLAVQVYKDTELVERLRANQLFDEVDARLRQLQSSQADITLLTQHERIRYRQAFIRYLEDRLQITQMLKELPLSFEELLDIMTAGGRDDFDHVTLQQNVSQNRPDSKIKQGAINDVITKLSTRGILIFHRRKYQLHPLLRQLVAVASKGFRTVHLAEPAPHHA